ncbi:MAG: hypothetical protein ACI4UT_03560 [Candidatus Enteromonas sp.]
MDDQSSKLLRLYNDLDEILRERYQGDKGFSYVARYASELRRSPSYSVSERGRKLDDIREIRNLLVHDLDMNADGLVLIPEATLSLLEREILLLKNPRTAYQVATPVSKLIRADGADSVPMLLASMKERGYMQLPFLDKKNRLIGVLSPNAILVFLGQGGTFHKDLRLVDLSEVLPIEKHICEHYAFLSRSATEEEASALYHDLYRKGKKLAMVFVTEHGLPEEAVIGILTAYDIVHWISDYEEERR